MDNKKIPTHLGTIVIVIIAITVGAFVWQYEKNMPDNATQSVMPAPVKKAPVQSVVAQSEEVIPSNIPADWKNYKNDKQGIEFRYPSAGIVSEDQGVGGLKSAYGVCIHFSLGTILISILNSPDCPPIRTGIGIGTEIKDLPGESVVIDGKSYNIGTKEFMDSDGSEKKDSIEGEIVISDAMSVGYSYDPKEAGKFRQIISTFKFTDQNDADDAVVSSTDWQTYTDAQHGFEFKYPAGFVVKKDEERSISILTKEQSVSRISSPAYVYVSYDTDNGILPKGTKINFAGGVAMESITKSDSGDFSVAYHISVVKNGFDYTISFMDKDKNSLTENDKRIISSFKFTK
ncbi:MAG: hypothetical protein WC848_00115 [Parcubacteria group bacterium]